MGQGSEIRLENAEPDQTGVVETQQTVALDYCSRWNNASQKVIIRDPDEPILGVREGS